MCKLVVTSFDKTLIDDDLAIPVSTVLTLDFLRRSGVKFVVATGRDANFIKDYVRDVNFIDYIVSLNGSYIYDVVREKIIYSKPVGKMIIKKIVNKYKDTRCKIYLYTDNSKCYLNVLGEETNDIIIRDLDDFLDNNEVFKIEVHTKTKKYSKEIVNDLENYSVNANYLEIDRDYFVEIVNEKVSKLNGINIILKKEKISLDDVVFYGYGDNDLSLLEKVGRGLILKNSLVKKYKKFKYDNNSKGVEKSLKEIFDVR